MPTTFDCTVLRDIYGTPAMRSVFDSRALVQGWLDCEAALARVQAELGVIPQAAADRIAAESVADAYDLDLLRRGIADSQHPLVPLIRELAIRAGEHGGHVHWGATTQDIIDTGLVLQVRQAVRLLAADLDRAIAAAAVLARRHARTTMAGRTHGQHAVPITFGFKAASWHDELCRCRARLVDAAGAALTAQLAGAAGTLASLGADGASVSRAFAAALGLRAPSVPWHVSRDRLRDLGHALDEVASCAERVAGEVIRLQSTEVAEVAEPATPGHVGSSTMPQKRNPMVSEYLVASCRLLRGVVTALQGAGSHAGERDMALWAVEWMAVPEAFILAGGIADKLAGILEGLEVRPDRMRANLALTDGGVMAEAAMMFLATSLGHEQAHALVMAAAKRATTEGTSLLASLSARPELAAVDMAALERALEPSAYLGWSADVAIALTGPSSTNGDHG